MVVEASFKSVVIDMALANTISDLNVDTKLSTLKPLHTKSLTRSFHFFYSDGRPIMINGWKAAGISATVPRCWNDDWQAIIDPFARMSMN